MALLFFLSSRPVPEPVRWLPIIAKLKLVHIIEYGALYLLFIYAIKNTTTYNKLEAFSLALMMTVLYGLTDEFHQIFVVGRTSRFIDVIADGVGGVVAQAVITISRKERH